MSSASYETSTGREASNDGLSGPAERLTGVGGYPYTLPFTEPSDHVSRCDSRIAHEDGAVRQCMWEPHAPSQLHTAGNATWSDDNDRVIHDPERGSRPQGLLFPAADHGTTAGLIADVHRRGLAEGLRQAAAGWGREWGADMDGGKWIYPCEDEAEARAYAAGVTTRRVVSRPVGEWEPAERDGGQP